MVDNLTVTPDVKPKRRALINITRRREKTVTEPPRASFVAPIIEEKVEVLIKEVIRIKPSDFSAFKHALEEFVADWDK